MFYPETEREFSSSQVAPIEDRPPVATPYVGEPTIIRYAEEPAWTRFAREATQRGFDITASVEECLCEPYAQHTIKISPYDFTNTSTGFRMRGFRADVPFMLTSVPGDSAVERDFSRSTESLTDVGLRAWNGLNYSGEGGVELVNFSRYSALIGYSALRYEVGLKDEIYEVFKSAGCNELEVEPDRKGPVGFSLEQ